MNWPTRTAKVLTWLGLLPFLIGSIIAVLPQGEQLWPILVVFVSTYAALIVTFIAGSQWGITRHHGEQPSSLILILSNVITLLAWLGILFPSWVVSWLILLACLWLVLAVDYKLMKQGVWPLAYLKLRLMATIAVTICFGLMIYFGQQFFY